MSAVEYVLLASVFYQRQEDGSQKKHRTGDVIVGLSEAKARRLLRTGAIALASDVAAAEAPAADNAPPPAPAEGGKPETDANKPVLVAWVKDNAVKGDGSDYSEAELKRMTKPQLWSIINAVADQPPTEGDTGDDVDDDDAEDDPAADDDDSEE